ncbi:hypothetical protein ACH5RR_018735 [Cinchona calisaya]|uniref:Uncharacterized protein n=1 Tax=Cinchona calisaya TaxID=153742 RepID=A0ABD2ZNZ2_9GENT
MHFLLLFVERLKLSIQEKKMDIQKTLTTKDTEEDTDVDKLQHLSDIILHIMEKPKRKTKSLTSNYVFCPETLKKEIIFIIITYQISKRATQYLKQLQESHRGRHQTASNYPSIADLNQ